jgi:GNAT superfamily N-acetyltransferase
MSNADGKGICFENNIEIDDIGAFMYSIVSVREYPGHLENAIDYLSSKWGVAHDVYRDCISHSITTDSPLPRWYLLTAEDDRIVGCFGLIANDFNSRQDLWPWLAALYVEESERGKELGGKMLAHGISEARRLGYNKLYLATDHIGYYEKYGFTYVGQCYGHDGEPGRIYVIDTGGVGGAAFGVRYIEESDSSYWFSLDRHLSESEFSLKIRDKRGFIILDDGKPIGVMSYNLFWDIIPFLTLIYIEETHQRKGFGRQAMLHWESEMRSLGYKMVMTSTQVDEQAQHFYRKLGYADMGSIFFGNTPIKQPQEIMMTKVIAGDTK